MNIINFKGGLPITPLNPPAYGPAPGMIIQVDLIIRLQETLEGGYLLYNDISLVLDRTK